MEALAFIDPCKPAVLSAFVRLTHSSSINLNPSEDSEALQRIDSGSPFHDRNDLVTPHARLAAGEPWFAIYTTCRHEKRVAQHMQQREIEHFLPVYETRRKWRDGSKVLLELPLFPCYIFVRMRRTERARVLSVPGALAVVNGTGGEAAPISDAAILALREGTAAGSVEPHSLVTVGQRVRIHSGPFAGMSGLVARTKSGFRVVLTLQQIMQSVAIEVDEDQVEVLGEEPATIHVEGAPGALCWQHA